MFKSILYILILTIIITLVQGQALQVGNYQRFQEGSCPTLSGTFIVSQDSFGYQMVNSKGMNVIANITVDPTDSSLVGVGYLYNVNPPYQFTGLTSVKGIAYNQYMLTTTYYQASGFSGATYYFQFSSC
ncbi:hypothetical protein ACTA71_004200 [Dictyostelium dimigraforme]